MWIFPNAILSCGSRKWGLENAVDQYHAVAKDKKRTLVLTLENTVRNQIIAKFEILSVFLLFSQRFCYSYLNFISTRGNKYAYYVRFVSKDDQ